MIIEMLTSNESFVQTALQLTFPTGMDFCVSETCSGRGTCTNRAPDTVVQGQPGYTCACPQGFVGLDCETGTFMNL